MATTSSDTSSLGAVPPNTTSSNIEISDAIDTSPIIQLDVGGTKFTTTRSTLTAHPESMLGAMFSGRFATKRFKGRHFIDRDGALFGHILNYLRCGDKWISPTDSEVRKALLVEAEFYSLPALVKLLAPKDKDNDSITRRFLECHYS